MLDRKTIAVWYERLFNSLNTYCLRDEELMCKIEVCFDLMEKYNKEIFVSVCENWLKTQNFMPTPKQLSLRCYQLFKDIEKKEEFKKPKICYELEFKKKNLLPIREFEEEICNSEEPINQYSSKYNSSVPICTFHFLMEKEKNGIDWNGYKGIFQFCKEKSMSYVESEIFIHKYLKADMSIRLQMIELLDCEHREALRKYLSNYNKKHDLESSLASVFKHVA